MADNQPTQNNPKSCNVEECGGEYYSLGFCRKHYQRFKRTGDPGPAGPRIPRKSTQCSVDGCENLIGEKGARGLCTKHYQMWIKVGDPCGSAAKTEAERFWEKVDRGNPDDCWEWTASKDENGYGLFKSEGATYRAHRWAYESTGSKIPERMVVDHLCRNRRCVNPRHMEPVTNQENLRRGWGRRLRNGMVDHCINGHKYTPENTYIRPPTDQKVCRKCSRLSQARYEQRKKASNV